jgi:hypothetical protein
MACTSEKDTGDDIVDELAAWDIFENQSDENKEMDAVPDNNTSSYSGMKYCSCLESTYNVLFSIFQ